LYREARLFKLGTYHQQVVGIRVRRIVVKICYLDNGYIRIFGLCAIRLTGYSIEETTRCWSFNDD